MAKTNSKTTNKKTSTTKTQAKKDNKNKSLLELKKELINVRLKIKAGQEKNTNAHKTLKKQIAQLLTRQNQH